MPTLVIVNDPKDWPLDIPGVEVVSSRRYLTDDSYAGLKSTRVFNLCRSYQYQSLGYYVSLLATARGHRPLPSVMTMQDLKSLTIVRSVTEDLDALIQRSMHPLQTARFVLSIYFGRNTAKRYDSLSRALFNLFPAPMLRAEFAHEKGHWQLARLRAVSMNEVPENHRPFILEVASEYFAGRRRVTGQRRVTQYDMAILHDPNDSDSSPSDPKALKKFAAAAEDLGFGVYFITKEDYGHVAEFDALFIRETTKVTHHTYRFARRAAAEGLVVIDDPESIVRCTNKVYLAEMLNRHRIPGPKTMVVHRQNAKRITETLDLPCILKEPDGSFSTGVRKAATEEELDEYINELLNSSDLVIAQEFTPTEFDWRIGILNRKPLYACRYHMAPKHWQIVSEDGRGRRRYGAVEAVPLEVVPGGILRNALRAANLIGDGLYGVDMKQFGTRNLVIEVNDNPTIETGEEDAILGDELYHRVMEVFLDRVRHRGTSAGRRRELAGAATGAAR
jgi:glutathione synthase/RimK-type ligase-like ATP-grasp enzyme